MSATTPVIHGKTNGVAKELEVAARLPGSNISEVNNSNLSEITKKAAEELERGSPPPPEPPKKKLCGVCKENEYKYKCSQCVLPYCSMACSTIHKASHPAEDPKPAVETEVNLTLPEKPPAARPGTLAGAANAANAAAANPRGPFAALDDSKELQELFKKHPQLEKLLDRIDKATLPPVNSMQQIQNGGRRKEQPWNSDRGLQKGIQVLNHLRNTGSQDGKAIAEFSKLVLRLLCQEGGPSARELVEKELAAENQEVLEQLLSGEH